jgi:hypothetical protein
MSAGTTIIDGAERFMDGMGLMTGEYAIMKRALFGALLGGFVVSYLKPNIMFESGQPRPWSLTAGTDAAGDATPFPWWMGPLIGGVITGVLI